MAQKNILVYKAQKILSTQRETKQLKDKLDQDIQTEFKRNNNRPDREQARNENKMQEPSWSEIISRRGGGNDGYKKDNEKLRQVIKNQSSNRIDGNTINDYYNTNFNNREEEITKKKKRMSTNCVSAERMNKEIDGIRYEYEELRTEIMHITEQRNGRIEEKIDK